MMSNSNKRKTLSIILTLSLLLSILFSQIPSGSLPISSIGGEQLGLGTAEAAGDILPVTIGTTKVMPIVFSDNGTHYAFNNWQFIFSYSKNTYTDLIFSPLGELLADSSSFQMQVDAYKFGIAGTLTYEKISDYEYKVTRTFLAVDYEATLKLIYDITLERNKLTIDFQNGSKAINKNVAFNWLQSLLINEYAETSDTIAFDNGKTQITFDWSDVTDYAHITTITDTESGKQVEIKFTAGTIARDAHIIIDPSTVGSSTSTYAIHRPHQRKVVYDASRFWLFYSDNGDNFLYTSSLDGISWETPDELKSSAYGAESYSIWFDSDNICIAYAEEALNTPLEYCQFTPCNNGTLTAQTAWQTVIAGSGSTTYDNPYVCKDTNGYPYIGFVDYTAEKPYVTRANQNDGTWTSCNFTTQMTTATSSVWCTTVVPQLNGKVMAVYAQKDTTIKSKVWNGSAWGTENATTEDTDWEDSYSVVSTSDGTVHLVFLEDDDRKLQYTSFADGGTAWAAEETLIDLSGFGGFPVLSKTLDDNLYVFYPLLDNHIYYMAQVAGVWDDSATDWLTETDVTANWSIGCAYAQTTTNYIPVIWLVDDGAPPYNVRFARLPVYETPTSGPDYGLALWGYSYYKEITLSEAENTTINYAVELMVGETSGATGEDFDLNGHCIDTDWSDGVNDIRFLDNDGVTLLHYWREATTGSGSNELADCWVEVTDNMEGASTEYIYIFYGKAGATDISCGFDTFPMFDDFVDRQSSNHASGWTEVSSTDNVQSGQGVCFDGTYYYTSSTTYIWKYYDNWTLISSHYTLDHIHGSLTQTNAISVRDGLLYTGSNNYPDKPYEAYIQVWDADDLSFIEEHEIDGATYGWNEGGDVKYVKGEWYFWAVYCGDSDPACYFITQWDSSWNLVKAHPAETTTTGSPNGFQGLAWDEVKSGWDSVADSIYCYATVHDGSASRVWRYNECTEVLEYCTALAVPSSDCGQGLCKVPGEDTMLFAERVVGVSNNVIYATIGRATYFDLGMWAGANWGKDGANNWIVKTGSGTTQNPKRLPGVRGKAWAVFKSSAATSVEFGMYFYTGGTYFVHAYDTNYKYYVSSWVACSPGKAFAAATWYTGEERYDNVANTSSVYVDGSEVQSFSGVADTAATCFRTGSGSVPSTSYMDTVWQTFWTGGTEPDFSSVGSEEGNLAITVSPSTWTEFYKESSGSHTHNLRENTWYSSDNDSNIDYFTLTNTSGLDAIDVMISSSDNWTGTGVTWDVSPIGEPGSATIGLWAGLEGSGGYYILIKPDAYDVFNFLVVDLASSATQDFGLKVFTCTSDGGNASMTGRVTLTAVIHT